MSYVWLLGLTLAAWEDMKYRQVSFLALVLLLVPGIWNLWCVWNQGTAEVGLYLAAAVVGVGMLLLSKATRGAMGEGDGLFFLVSACYLDIGEICILFLGSLGICCVWGVLLTLRGSRKTAIPFLTCAWPVGIWLMCW